MPRPGKHFPQKQPNSESIIQSFEFPLLYSSYFAINARLEIEKEVLHSKDRRTRRIMIKSNYLHPKLFPCNNQAQIMAISTNLESLNSETTGFTVNYLKPDFKIENKMDIMKSASALSNPPSDSKRDSNKQIPRSIKMTSIAKQSLTADYLKNYQLKDDNSEGHLREIKIKKHDYEEIIAHIALCYTFQMIEASACLEDRDWSGSYIPSMNDDAELLYSGGYGLIDGVTECNKMNLAMKKYQNIDFNNDEAVDALSHMYSMQHLLDGVTTGLVQLKRMPIKVTSTTNESDDSESSRLSFF